MAGYFNYNNKAEKFMTEKEDLRNEIKSLKSQVNALEGMVKNLMNMHKNVLESLSIGSEVEDRYIKLLSVYERFGRISTSIMPEIEDPVSERIVEVLLSEKSANISQITRGVRQKRGSGSRHTIRKRLNKLENKGVVEKSDDGNGKNYRLTQEIVEKWAKMLGIKK